ncbi:hypothetical protein F5B22DRAFT_628771 [Xylaria bambusicola]|uniref:uncharacterized protein n=1 Tax=Xylaria bambusicola TaxID=326684 RepID=UPI0020080B1E|nr:uncharacterized protein F5B22DRAFT_628771 [Xylaria bambusicola]KAI0505162.1 hypothetical protein F5B22DRAFT_628771 [Xylaria bambusicola]
MKSYALRITWFVSVFYFHKFFDDIRTNTFNLLSASLIGMMSIGTFVGAQLLKFNVWLLCLLIVCTYVLLIVLAYLLLHERHDDLSDRSYIDREAASVEERRSLVSTDSISPSPTRPLQIESPAADVVTKPDSTIFRTLLRAATVDIYLSVELVIQTVLHPFTRHIMILFFAYTLGGTISGTSPQWASSTFNARLANIDQIRAMEMIISAFVLLSLPVLSNYVLRPRLRTKQAVDIWVITASMIALLTGTLTMAMAPSLVVYTIGVAISAMGVGVADALRSFATSALSDGDALERLYVCIRTMQSLASMAGTPLWSGLFLLILSNPLLPHGLLFVGNAFVYLVCLILARFLHR